MKSTSPTDTFLHEADDLLARIEETALQLCEGDIPEEAIGGLFRAFHTIKGSGAMFGFDEIAAFTHHVETALDSVREGKLELSQHLIGLLLGAKDHIKQLLDASRGGAVVEPNVGDTLIAEFVALSGAPGDVARNGPASTPADGEAPVSAEDQAEVFEIHFRPSRDLMVRGTSPGSLLDQLRALGACTVTADLSAIPPLDRIVPDECYLSWQITLETRAGVDAIKDVFVFVEEGAELKIQRRGVKVLPGPTAFAGATSAPAPSLAGGVAESRSLPREKDASRTTSVRVSSDRLDRLVRLVGELVTNQSRLVQVAARAGMADLDAASEDLDRLVAELRETVLGIRMTPIGTTFGRFKRLVHDLSRDLGKEIDLVTEGADTELDKTVLDQLGEPLVHLVRNSIDHGIEPPEERAAAGKPRRGCIRLAASHEGSHVSVSIQDDGRGIDAARVRAKAVEKRLIDAGATLSEQEMLKLIFLPGFSTASTVTSLSGRGVGMDVVKRQLEALRGTIHIASVPHTGTTITLTLPLTLAIIEGLLVEIGRSQFIVPMSAVSENVEITAADRHRNNGRNLVDVRGQLVPYVRLRELFAVEGKEPGTEMAVLVMHNGERVGVVVDRVLGSHQTVIQSLGSYCRNVAVVSGATIMGDGRVALILDIGTMIRMAEAAMRGMTGAPRHPAVLPAIPAA